MAISVERKLFRKIMNNKCCLKIADKAEIRQNNITEIQAIKV